ncbi:MAG: hypothetical protein JW866_10835 [Ignavibacteriales bacterium]|nr:hypothetical protein [Ignavibacteriales bacterium]
MPNEILSQRSRTLSEGIFYISDFIASDYFLSLKEKKNDLDLVDTIYVRALKYYNYDYSEALLALTFATLPFNKIPLKIPFLNVKLNIPLPSACDSVFQIKLRNLPSQFFFDTPKYEFGDKDKLPHFFGNAFLSYNISFFNISEFFGILVELFEESFAIDGRLNLRDIRVNRIGSEFGKLLEDNNNILPSQMFLIYTLIYRGIIL